VPGTPYRWPADFVPLILWLGAAGALGGLAYGGVAALLGVAELRAAWARVRGLVMRA
jgi:hypothetical protein